jgi:hypothetical protein
MLTTTDVASKGGRKSNKPPLDLASRREVYQRSLVLMSTNWSKLIRYAVASAMIGVVIAAIMHGRASKPKPEPVEQDGPFWVETAPSEVSPTQLYRAIQDQVRDHESRLKRIEDELARLGKPPGD